MALIFKVIVETAEKEGCYRITWQDKQTKKEEFFDSSAADLSGDELEHLWFRKEFQFSIGEKLFRFLDGDRRFLEQAVSMGQEMDERVILQLYLCRETANWPFELLANEKGFLLVNRVHLARCVSDWGKGKESKRENRPLKLIFMVCSALDVEPELDFEKEEEAIVEVTGNLPMDIEVEDSGSLAGLGEKLLHTCYDVVHLSGHAGIDEKGRPIFVMEDELGFCDEVDAGALWNKALKLNPPRVLFLSGCRTGQSPASSKVFGGQGTFFQKGPLPPEALFFSMSFAGSIAELERVPIVLGWGRPVSDMQAMAAAEVFYRELSRGCTVLDALANVREELLTGFGDTSFPEWPLLRVFGSEMVVDAIVEPGQKAAPKAREMKRRFLKNSRVQVLETGFVGRRRQLQASLKSLLRDKDKVGVLLHGTGGLGKSCLAGKLCERLGDHHLIIVHGRFNAITLAAALKDAFIAARDEEGKKVLEAAKEMGEKLAELCAGSFREKNYLVVLDDFEQNLEFTDMKTQPKVFGGQGTFFQKGPLPPEAKEIKDFVLSEESAVLLHTLLHYLPFAGKMTQLVITSRYLFTLTEQGSDLAAERLQRVGLTRFRGPEQWKKARELAHIMGYLINEKYAALAAELIELGKGNPRLMEWIDVLVGEMGEAEAPELVAAVKGKQEEFIQSHVLRELVLRAGEEVERFLKWFSIYRVPVFKEGAGFVAAGAGLENWEECLARAVGLSLVEYDGARDLFGVTEMLREELEKGLSEIETVSAHRGAIEYYGELCEEKESIDPVLHEEWIYHALGCGEEEIASEQGGRLVTALRERLAFLESVRVGEWVLALKKKECSTEHDAFLLNELAFTINDLGDKRKAISLYEQALAIWKVVYGENHQDVATTLNNLGAAWDDLGDKRKAISLYEQALAIDERVFGKEHPNVAIRLNNLGEAWRGLGEAKKAISLYEQALAIDERVFGKNHPNVAIRLNNLGAAWDDLGDKRKAISFYEQALAIDERVFGKEHPDVAIDLNNLGSAYFKLGEKSKARPYFEKAYAILKKFFGDQHPNTITVKEWLDKF